MASTLEDDLFGCIIDANALKQKQLEIDNKIRDVYKQKVSLKSIPVVTRNIVLIGRSRSGKSTFKKTLINPTLVTADMSIFSDTKETSIQSFLIHSSSSFLIDPSAIGREDTLSNNHFVPVVLNIMDTPGLSEKNDNGCERTDEELLDIISKAMNKEMNQYHAIFFFASLESGSNKEDLEAFVKFRDLLGENIRDHSCLVITRCESKTQDQMNALLNQMRQLNEYKDMLDYFKGGIYFFGALAYDTFNLANSSELERQFQTITNMRRKVLDFIFAKKTSVDIMNLNMSDVKRLLAEQKNLTERIKELSRLGESKANELAKLKAQLGYRDGCTVM